MRCLLIVVSLSSLLLFVLDILFGTVSGTSHSILESWSVSLPNKHGRGGQSSVRFGIAIRFCLVLTPVCVWFVFDFRVVFFSPVAYLTSDTCSSRKFARRLPDTTSEATANATLAVSSLPGLVCLFFFCLLVIWVCIHGVVDCCCYE